MRCARHSEELEGLGVQEIVDHYAAIIAELPEPPIVIGHSFGGLIAQILLGQGIGRATVAMDPAAPKGIKRVPLSSLKVASPALSHPLRAQRRRRRSTSSSSTTRSRTRGRRPRRVRPSSATPCPETARILFEDGLANFTLHGPTEVDFDREDRGPLLITVGEHDHTTPPAVAKENFRKYRDVEADDRLRRVPRPLAPADGRRRLGRGRAVRRRVARSGPAPRRRLEV